MAGLILNATLHLAWADSIAALLLLPLILREANEVRRDDICGCRVYNFEMQRLRKLGLLGLLLMISFAPVMACMVPDAQMTTQERACCRMMKGECGPMDMPASHGCCKKVAGNASDTALKTNTSTLHPVVHVVYVLLSLDLFPPTIPVNGWFGRPDHSLPKPPPSIVSNLRV